MEPGFEFSFRVQGLTHDTWAWGEPTLVKSVLEEPLCGHTSVPLPGSACLGHPLTLSCCLQSSWHLWSSPWLSVLCGPVLWELTPPGMTGVWGLACSVGWPQSLVWGPCLNGRHGQPSTDWPSPSVYPGVWGQAVMAVHWGSADLITYS